MQILFVTAVGGVVAQTWLNSTVSTPLHLDNKKPSETSVANDVSYALDPSMGEKDVVTFLENEIRYSPDAAWRACRTIVCSDAYGDYLRTWCLLALKNSFRDPIDDLVTLTRLPWFNVNWLNTDRVTTYVSMEDKCSTRRTRMTVYLDCPFVNRLGKCVSFEIEECSRLEFTEFVDSIKKEVKANRVTYPIGHFQSLVERPPPIGTSRAWFN